MAVQAREFPPDSPWQALRDFGLTRQEGTAEAVAARVQELILARDLPDGSRLPSERDLAVLLSTSRPTVSQAIRILVIKGLVESRRGSGVYVRLRPEATLAASMGLMLEMEPGSVGQLAEVRLTLESSAVVRAIERATPAELDRAQEALAAFAHSGGDTASWMSADTRFHATLVSAAHNTYLASMFDSVHTTLINHEYRTWIDNGTVPEWLAPARIPALTAIHEPILDAVRRRDVESALYAVRHHHEVMTANLEAGG
ncbi:FadR/GntR family transcriptional regulator [Streptomyces sp. NPDC059477]|uniref:FadR/GntR family transcriptional regulator n=1 Tax=Streptomyces sp. NPDC059477 TaxID=3346847 RepID=UPI0036A07990